MTPEQFVYWLQGCLEITDPKQLGEKELTVIKDHIALVLKKETPHRSLGSLLVPDPKMTPGDIKVLPSQTTTLPYVTRGYPSCVKHMGQPCTCSLCMAVVC